MAVSRFKLIAAAALLTVVGTVAHAGDVPLTPTQEYRLWSAEQMVKRLAEKFGKSIGVCKQVEDWRPRLSEQCTSAVVATYPILGMIREIAASGDEARWVAAVYVVHTLEDEITQSGILDRRR